MQFLCFLRRARLLAEPHPIMDIPIDTKKKVRLSNRDTNLLEPTYFIAGRYVSDELKYIRPAPLKQFIADGHLLRTNDIKGATAKLTEELHATRREFRHTNFLGDIDGAHHGSIKSSIVTERVTNPLNPVYKSLDDGSPIRGPLESLIPPETIKVPTIFQKKTTASNHVNLEKVI